MKMHWVTKIAGLLVGTVLSASAIALPLQNGDFSNGANGFENWEGTLTDTNIVETNADFGAHTAFYSTNGAGAATLTPDETYWSVLLYQIFDVPTTAGILTLSFSYDWTISSSTDDFVLGELEDQAQNNPLSTLSLLDSYTSMPTSGAINLDITAFAGREVNLLFLIEDGNDPTNDKLIISNIAITETVVSVPAPPALALLFAGLAGLLYRTKRD